MNAREAEDYLLDLELFGMRFGLDRMRRLMTVLGSPERSFASIHVVGTNGKSSTTRMAAAILAEHGARTGAYTSPHLRSFAERIEVGETSISDADFARAVTRARHAAELVDRTAAPDDRVTQFEALTAAALWELARREVDVAVIEAGLGGRYDATNVLPSRVQVLTSVALDHTRWLGPTLADIAGEKLDVVTRGGTLVTGDLPDEVEPVVERVVAERGARRVRAPADPGVPVAAPGSVQRRNFAVARTAAAAFRGDLDDDAVARAAARVRIPGRVEVLPGPPLEIRDGAHNPAAAHALADDLPRLAGGRPIMAVVSILDDKDAAGILAALLPACERAVLTRCAVPRALPPGTLASLAEQVAPAVPTEIVADPAAALDRARRAAGSAGAVLVTGSLHLLSDLVRDASARRASML